MDTLNSIFGTVLAQAAGTATLSIGDFLLCTVVSLLLGVVAGLFYLYHNSHYNKGFVITLAILPAVVQLVIMLVNGNLGAGLAVMGAFALVRFRSIPGSAKDIAAVFFSMAIGLATGMGFLAIAAVFTVIIGIAQAIWQHIPIGAAHTNSRQLKITIPETLDFEQAFDPIFAANTSAHELVSLKTSNMGSLYKLHYTVALKPGASPKAFLDELRTRNGNLEVALGTDIFNTNQEVL
jgi:uncharacterized membrane protein YhiD involved in acid resistance